MKVFGDCDGGEGWHRTGAADAAGASGVLLLVRKPPVAAGHADPNTNPSPLAGVNANLRGREVLGGGVPVGTSGAAAQR